MNSIRRLAAAAFTLALVAATALHAGTPRPHSTFRNARLSFAYPAGWLAASSRAPGAVGVTPIAYVSSTRPAHDPCASRDGESVCGWPVGRLQPGAMVVVWENRSFPGWSLAATPGAKLRVGGRPARRTTTHPGECSAIGGDETIHVAIERPIASSWTSVTACLRRPNLATAEERLAALLATTRFLAP